MLKKITSTIFILLAVSGLAAAALPAHSTQAAAYNPLDLPCQGSATSSSTCKDKNNPDSISGPNGIIMRVTNIVALAVAIVAVIMIVIYGIMIVISYGDSAKVTQARNAIIGATVGLAVAALARVIVAFALSKL